MCKYCEETEAIWFKKKNIYKGTVGEYEEGKEILGGIFDMENDNFFKSKTYLSISTDKKEWLDIRIKYCPFCGKKLTRKSLSNTIKAIIDYKYNKKHDNDLIEGIATCSKCGKNIKNELKPGESITYEGKNIYCQECSKNIKGD